MGEGDSAEAFSHLGPAFQAVITRELEAIGARLEDVSITSFEKEVLAANPQHFVLGNDKGSLWKITRVGSVTSRGRVRVFWQVCYQPSAVHISVDVRGAPPGTRRMIVHGGAIAAVIDAIAACTGALTLESLQAATAEQLMRYKRPVFVHDKYLFVGRADVTAEAASFATCTIEDEAGRVCLESETTMKRRRDQKKKPPPSQHPRL